MARIFVRERRHVGRRTGRPRFAVVAVEGELTFARPWLRRAELEHIAEETGMAIVYLPARGREHGRGSRREE